MSRCSLAIIILLLVSCHAAEKRSIGESADNLPEIYSEKVDIRFAKNFKVKYIGNFKLVELSYATEMRNIAINQKLLLVPRGTPPTDIPGDLKDAWVIPVPVKTVAANDDGEVTRLTTLGLVENLVAMGGGAIYDTSMRKRWEDSKLVSIGYSISHAPAPEVMLNLAPELALLYTFDNNRLSSIQKQRKLGVNAIPTFAWAENTYLGKAEWIKFTALFFNKEPDANSFFDEIERKCSTVLSRVDSTTTRPKAFWVYFPSEECDWIAHRNDFFASYIEGAGGVNVLKDEGPTHPVGISNEHLLREAKEADFWIVNDTSDISWPPARYLQLFKAYRDGNVYHYHKRTRYEHDAYDWYETAEVRPDLVLDDLSHIFYPDNQRPHEFFFFKKVTLTKSK